jgi:hypothetical protein
MTIDEAMHVCATEPINSERFREAQQALINHARRRALRQQAELRAEGPDCFPFGEFGGQADG